MSYRMCTRCIMDTSDPAIVFDGDGVCQYCHFYDEQVRTRVHTGEAGEREARKLVDAIKAAGKGKPYDCVMGVSGGVDSTYLAYVAHKFGLRPLAVHLDNGWDSELAVSNIEKVLKKVGVDLDTHVLDWEEFRDLQLSFLKASVSDAEVPTDHAIIAVVYRAAAQRGISYMLTGNNVATEAVLPVSWTYGIYDWRYIKDVHRRFGTRPLRTYPHFGRLAMRYWLEVLRIQTVDLLNYVPYVRDDVMRVLQEELGWRYYGGKHYESIYTRFFQSYILPSKFGIDKRRAHFSNLVLSGQMTRAQALAGMEEVAYPADLMAQDREYVIKKLGLTEAAFDSIMALPCKTHRDYHTMEKVTEVDRFLRAVSRLGRRGAKMARRLTPGSPGGADAADGAAPGAGFERASR